MKIGYFICNRFLITDTNTANVMFASATGICIHLQSYTYHSSKPIKGRCSSVIHIETLSVCPFVFFSFFLSQLSVTSFFSFFLSSILLSADRFIFHLYERYNSPNQIERSKISLVYSNFQLRKLFFVLRFKCRLSNLRIRASICRQELDRGFLRSCY